VAILTDNDNGLATKDTKNGNGTRMVNDHDSDTKINQGHKGKKTAGIRFEVLGFRLRPNTKPLIPGTCR